MPQDIDEKYEKAWQRLEERKKREPPEPPRVYSSQETIEARRKKDAQAFENDPTFEGWCQCAFREGRIIYATYPERCGDCKKRLDPRKE